MAATYLSRFLSQVADNERAMSALFSGLASAAVRMLLGQGLGIEQAIGVAA